MIINIVIGAVISGLIGLLVWFMRSRFSRAEDKLDCLEKKVIKATASMVSSESCEEKREEINKTNISVEKQLSSLETGQGFMIDQIKKLNSR